MTPILFLIYVSNIPETPAEISQFADDFALFYRSKSGQLIQSKLHASLNILIKWCDQLKIKINPAKTQYMLFRNPSKRQTSLSLNINGKQIEEAKSIKFLGVTMRPHLNWNEHCKDITIGANMQIFQLRRLSNLKVEQECSLLLYKSWIRPLFLYANACWLNQSQTVISIIQNVQHRALKICLRKPRWSPRSHNQIKSFPQICGVGALPDSIPLTKVPGCKNFYDLGTAPVTFDETSHAAPNWRENDKSFSSHLPNMLEKRYCRLGGSKTEFMKKVTPLAIFCSAVRSSTGRSVIARKSEVTDVKNFSESCVF